VRVSIAGTVVRVAISDGEPVQVRIAGGTHSLKDGAAVEVHAESAAAAPP
jgi:hypothetical protein